MNQNADCTKQQPAEYKKMKVKIYAVMWAIVGILLYIADVFTDLSLAVNYYYEGHTKFFCLTLLFVVFSAIVSSIFSLYMYWSDRKDEELKVTKRGWILRAIFLFLGFAPVLRNIDSVCFAWKSYQSENRKMKQYYARRMIFEITDSSFLRLFEAFLESGPQLVLQIYIFVQMKALSPDVFTKTQIWQCCTMLMSMISISGSIVAYSNSLRNSLDQKNEFTKYILALLFLWRFFEVISRVIPMGLGVSASPYFIAVFIVHFIVVTIWICFMKTEFCEHRCAEKVYNVLLGVILTFVFLNPEDSPTKKRCILFYVGMFAENSFLMAFWFYRYSCSEDQGLLTPIVAVQISSFCLSIIFMVIHYKFFHPTVGVLCKKIPTEMDYSKNYPKTVTQNGDAGAMLELVQN